MAKALVVIVPLVLAIYCLVQVAQARAEQVRTFPRWAWALLIALVPVFGALAWLVLGRPREVRRRPPPRPRRTLGPDDDPDFLRGLRPDKPRDEPTQKPTDKPDDQR